MGEGTPHERADVLVVCALYEEAEAFLEMAEQQGGASWSTGYTQQDRYQYRVMMLKNRDQESVRVVVTWPPQSGPIPTGLALLQEFQPRLVAMSGICAGDKKQVKLGDIVVAQLAYFYEVGK